MSISQDFQSIALSVQDFSAITNTAEFGQDVLLWPIEDGGFFTDLRLTMQVIKTDTIHRINLDEQWNFAARKKEHAPRPAEIGNSSSLNVGAP